MAVRPVTYANTNMLFRDISRRGSIPENVTLTPQDVVYIAQNPEILSSLPRNVQNQIAERLFKNEETLDFVNKLLLGSFPVIGGGIGTLLGGPAGGAIGAAGGAGLSGALKMLIARQPALKSKYQDALKKAGIDKIPDFLTKEGMSQLMDQPQIQQLPKFTPEQQERLESQEQRAEQLGQFVQPRYMQQLAKLQDPNIVQQAINAAGGPLGALATYGPLLYKGLSPMLNPQVPQGKLYPDMPRGQQQGLGATDFLGALVPILISQFAQSPQEQQVKSSIGGDLSRIGSGLRSLAGRK